MDEYERLLQELVDTQNRELALVSSDPPITLDWETLERAAKTWAEIAISSLWRLTPLN